ncbi:helix-turn-helix transcriptional regulator [Ralstonia solanacearum]|uniref:helix-turn-helix transcriptional regulator n=1 Tax=Ralstonia solanacearum TaxID=305 RepID=UPI000B23BEDF|nr:helix-turn-helix domain-containing protein [Ralstonia solanacearum]
MPMQEKTVTKDSTPGSGALLFRINVAEAKLGVSRSTIYRLAKTGELELVKIGSRSSGITAASVHAMIERNKVSR